MNFAKDNIFVLSSIPLIIFFLLSIPGVDYSFTTERNVTVYDNGKPVSIKGRCDIEKEVPKGNNVYHLLVECKKENGDIDVKKFTKEGSFPSYEDEVVKQYKGEPKPSIAKQIFGVDINELIILFLSWVSKL